jgi:hypothetical protein
MIINRFQNNISNDSTKPSINSSQKGNPVFKYLTPADKYFRIVET